MEDLPCKKCATPNSAYVYHYGGYMSGGYGSAKYDMRRLAWIGEPPLDLKRDDAMCDACVTHLVKEGKLEMFGNGGELSKAGYESVFLLGANEAYEDCMSEIRPQMCMSLDGSGVAAIERLRAKIERDHTGASSHAFRVGEDLSLAAYKTGKSHGFATVIIGYTDEGFPDAAEKYAEKMIERGDLLTELLDSLEEATRPSTSADET